MEDALSWARSLEPGHKHEWVGPQTLSQYAATGLRRRCAICDKYEPIFGETPADDGTTTLDPEGFSKLLVTDSYTLEDVNKGRDALVAREPYTDQPRVPRNQGKRKR